MGSGAGFGSGQGGGDVDIAVRRLGVRADQMRRLDQLLRDLAVHAGHADGEARAQEVGAVGIVQIDLGIDRELGRQLDLPLGGGELDRAEVAGRPGRGEELFGGGTCLDRDRRAQHRTGRP